MTNPVVYIVGATMAGIAVFLLLSFFFEWFERKIVARIQKRVGPYYTGPQGLLQPFFDFMKLLLKREKIPGEADILLYRLAPLIGVVFLTYGFLHIPFLSPEPVLSFRGDLLVIILIFAFTSFSYMLAGLSVRTPFTVLGTSRLIVQYSLYEALFLSAFALVFLQLGSASISGIVGCEIAGEPLVFYQPIAFAVAVFSILAKLEKPPFDIPHAKQEIAAGWMSELSSRTLAYIRLANDMDYTLSILLVVSLFLGAGSGPYSLETPFLWPIYFLLKALAIILLLSYIEGIAVRVRSILLPLRLGLPLSILLALQAVLILMFKGGLV